MLNWLSSTLIVQAVHIGTLNVNTTFSMNMTHKTKLFYRLKVTEILPCRLPRSLAEKGEKPIQEIVSQPLGCNSILCCATSVGNLFWQQVKKFTTFT